jgi:hypothetical protein
MIIPEGPRSTATEGSDGGLWEAFDNRLRRGLGFIQAPIATPRFDRRQRRVEKA